MKIVKNNGIKSSKKGEETGFYQYRGGE